MDRLTPGLSLVDQGRPKTQQSRNGQGQCCQPNQSSTHPSKLSAPRTSPGPVSKGSKVKSLLIGLLLTAPLMAQPRLVDAAGPFLKFWQKYRDESIETQRQAFQREVVSIAPELYAKLFQYGSTHESTRIDHHLQEFPSLEQRFQELYTQMHSELPKHLERFQREFPDLDPNAVDVYLLHSLGGSNGALDVLGQRRIFYLGLDMIALHNNYPSQKAFFDHEFFHAYHMQFYPISEAFYNKLWFEGLATYVAVAMNPNAGLAELQMPDPMRQEVEARLPALLDDISKNLESQDKEFLHRYTWLEAPKSDVPNRAAYYLGYRIARQLARKHSLSEMVHWDPPTVLRQIRQAIDEIRKGDPS